MVLCERRFLFCICQVAWLCAARRVLLKQKDDVQRFADASPADAPQHKLDDQIHDLINGALVGQWETDYYPTFSSGWMTSSAHVYVHAVPQDEIAKYVHGETYGHMQFLAESSKFGGDQGSGGRRELTVVQIFPYEGLNMPLAVLEQRFDSMHPVRHVGNLFPTSDGWKIEWEHKRIWTRHFSDDSNSTAGGGPSPPKIDSKRVHGAEAEDMAFGYLQKWDELCEATSGQSVVLDMYLGVGVSAGWGALEGLYGASGSIKVMVFANPHTVQTYQNRMKCLVDHVQRWAEHQPEEEKSNRSMDVFHQVRDQFNKWTSPSQVFPCWPAFGVTISFSILHHPPYLWPIPTVSIAFSWPLLWGDIQNCGKAVGAVGFLDKAFASQREDAEDDKPLSDVKKEARAIKLDVVYAQGPSLTVFPFPSSLSYAVGWSVFADIGVTMNLRKVVRSWRRAQNKLLGRTQIPPCEIDRADFFKSVIKWAKSVYDIMREPSCDIVRERLRAIQAEHPGANIEDDPFSVVPYLRQLDNRSYRQNESIKFALGGGWVWMGNTGISTGYYHSIFSSGQAMGESYRNKACRPYERFVNIYQKEVVHLQNEVQRMDRDEECQVNKLPSLRHGSCEEANVGAGDSWKGIFMLAPANPELMDYPFVFVDRLLPNQIVAITDSHCTRCLSIRAYGDPCVFCAESSFTARCTSRFHASWTCLAQASQVPLNHFDYDNVEPILQCVRKENLRFDGDWLGEQMPSAMPTHFLGGVKPDPLPISFTLEELERYKEAVNDRRWRMLESYLRNRTQTYHQAEDHRR